MVYPKVDHHAPLQNGQNLGSESRAPFIAWGQASHGKGDERDQGRSDASNPQRLARKAMGEHRNWNPLTPMVTSHFAIENGAFTVELP